MALHLLESSQTIPGSLEGAWAFFSDPRNLARITPAGLDFQVLSELPERVYAGLMIEYRVRPLLGVPVRWVTEITQVERLRYFVDEQRIGPYRVWHHEHWFHDLGDGRVEMRDKVSYVLPFGVLGELAHPWVVRPQLAKIFAFREEAVGRLFGGGGAGGAG